MAKVQNYGGGLKRGGASSKSTGAYANPQRQTNQLFEQFLANRPTVDEEMDQVLSTIVANNKLERAKQEQLFAQQNTEQRAMYDKVAGIKETGYGTFDQNMNDFFDNQVDNYFKIKQGIQDGSISQTEGNRHLSYLNNQVVGFKDAIVPIMAQTKRLQEALKIPPGQPGSISSRVPTAQQEVLLALSQGGNVKLVDDNGQLCLFKPGEDGEADAMINVNELLQLENSGKEYFKTVPDISESLKGVYDNTVKPGGKDNADLVMFETQRIGDQEATVKFMTPEQRTKAAESMVKSNQFKGILDDEERMQSIWADMMGKDTDWMDVEGATAEETEANIKKQRDEAARWMANKSIEDNAAADGIKMIQSTRKYKPPTTTTSETTKENVLKLETKEQIATYGDDYESMTLEANDYVGKPEEVLDRATYYGGGDIGFITKDQILAADPDFKDKDKLRGDVLYRVDIDEEGNELYDSRNYVLIQDGEQIAEFFAKSKGLNDAAIQQLKNKYPTKKETVKPNNKPAIDYQAKASNKETVIKDKAEDKNTKATGATSDTSKFSRGFRV